jgi:hypothetical protein
VYSHIRFILISRKLSTLYLYIPERKRPLSRPRRRWVDNIKMDFQEVGCGGTDWVGLIEDKNRCRALVNAVMNLRVP